MKPPTGASVSDDAGLPLNSNGEIIPMVPIFSISAVSKCIAEENKAKAEEHYATFCTLFGSVFNICSAALQLNTWASSEVSAVLQAFSGLTVPLRASVTLSAAFSSLLPTAMSNAFLEVLSTFQPQLKVLVPMVSGMGGGNRENKDLFMSKVKSFVYYVYLLFYLSKAFSQMDDIRHAMVNVKETVNEIPRLLMDTSGGAYLKIFATLNTLQGVTLCYTSMIRARLSMMKPSALHRDAEDFIQNFEEHSADISKEAGTSALTPGLQSKIRNLIHQLSQFEEQLLPKLYDYDSNNNNSNNNNNNNYHNHTRDAFNEVVGTGEAWSGLKAAHVQLLSVVDAHKVDGDATYIASLEKICELLGRALKLVSASSPFPSSPPEWAAIASAISQNLSNIIQRTQRTSLHAQEMWKPLLQKYYALFSHLHTEFRISAGAWGMGIRVQGYSSRDSCGYFLNCFAYLAFPFGYTIKEASASVS